jgi:predicted amidohydrolase
MKVTLSLAQLAFEFGAVEANFEHAAPWIAEAAQRGSALVLLPELWASGYDLPHWQRYAAPLDQGAFARLADLARQHEIAIGSSLLEEYEGTAYNTFVLFGAQGSRWGVYRKIHRFRLLDEEQWLGAGDQLVAAETPWGLTGLSICYDLRFPEMFRPYALGGVKLVLVVAEWPLARIAHWTKLLQARAIENQLFMAGVNKVGQSQGAPLGGGSAVIDPWGMPLVEGDQEERLLTAELDFDEVEQARHFIPVFEDRRPDVYTGGGGGEQSAGLNDD